MHAIIERTANFVCKQGAQFEIMLKAKQARNSQFDFLRFDHYLNPYYKFIQKAMKEGRYTVLAENKSEEKKSMWDCFCPALVGVEWGRGKGGPWRSVGRVILTDTSLKSTLQNLQNVYEVLLPRPED